MGLPTKHDQERTLHALNQIQSRLIDIEDRLHAHEAKLAEAVKPKAAPRRKKAPAKTA
jgi:hypothetical protein